ncbi:unnamed protein product [Onchocerca ochengi]|uniref:Coiled-coil domain-containing protein 147 n=2 Tax=Onchocerca TaxID=6281 RepID=A0A182EHZ1_ONCOC|nr:unnamed protein product [Onchocerca ochengi]
MSFGDSLNKLFEQYDQEMADVEVDLAVHEKLLKFMKEKHSTNEQQISSMQKNTEQTEKEMQLLDEKTNELVQSTSLQSEKIEKLKSVQKQITSDIYNAQNCLLTAQNGVRKDLEKLHSMETEVQKFLESHLVSPNFSGVDLRLRNYQKTFSSQVQESINNLASVKSFADEADRLKDLEKAVKEIKMDVINLEEQIGNADAQRSAWHKKIAQLNAKCEGEKQRRNAISEKYKQRKKHIAELTRALNDRKNDKKMLSESMNAKEQELNRNKDHLKKKNADIAAIQQEIDTITEDLAKLEKLVKFEHETHEQKVQEIKEKGEADICAIKSVLMALHEKESVKLLQIQQAHADLNKKSEWETHKKINEEMERNLEQLKQEKIQLQLALNEKENRRSKQLSEMKTMKCAFQENKLEVSKRREFLMREMKRMSENIQELKQKIEMEERRLKAKQDAVDRELKLMAISKKVGVFAHEKKCPKNSTEAAQGILTKRSTDQEGTQQKLQKTFDKVVKTEESVKDVKAENSGGEEISVPKTDPQKLLPKKKSAANEKLDSTPVVSESKNSFLAVKRTDRRGRTQMSKAEQEESKLSQPIIKKNILSVSGTLSTAVGRSKIGRQTRKKRESGKEKTVHTVALTLFDSDISSSTIKPIYSSTPLLHKKDESSFYGSAVKDMQKKRGRSKGKKAATGIFANNDNSKVVQKKDAYDLDSNSD